MCNSYLGSYVRELERKLAEYQRWDAIIGEVERRAGKVGDNDDFTVEISRDDYLNTQDDVPETESEQVKLIDQMYVALSDVESRFNNISDNVHNTKNWHEYNVTADSYYYRVKPDEVGMSYDEWVFSDVRKSLAANIKLIDNLPEHL